MEVELSERAIVLTNISKSPSVIRTRRGIRKRRRQEITIRVDNERVDVLKAMKSSSLLHLLSISFLSDVTFGGCVGVCLDAAIPGGHMARGEWLPSTCRL